VYRGLSLGAAQELAELLRSAIAFVFCKLWVRGHLIHIVYLPSLTVSTPRSGLMSTRYMALDHPSLLSPILPTVFGGP
jgi:hypothetical protein